MKTFEITFGYQTVDIISGKVYIKADTEQEAYFTFLGWTGHCYNGDTYKIREVLDASV